ncbi:hypothetical protein HY091_02005 [Candidatus Kaiserbacteria bacterium]|nr:hypothetical protein [Candidatus Kaiserbacteria bacterium]
MVQKINTYLAVLAITIVGSGAALLIVHIATAQSFAVVSRSSEAGYSSLEKSLLQP